jgi:ketosteroid isomerase-like protein
MTEVAGNVARRLFSAWNDGGLAAVADDYWPAEIEWRDDPTVPDAGVFKGRDEVRKHIEERVEILGDFEITVERVLETGWDRVLVVFEFRGAGGRSGAPYAMRVAQHLTVDGGRVAEVQDYLDPDGAFAQLT